MPPTSFVDLFAIVQSFIRKEKPVLNQEYDWDELFHYAKIHSLSGIVGYIVTKYELYSDKEYASRFEYQMIHAYGIQYRRSMQMERLLVHLNEHGIDHLLMKGFVVKDLYPVPELRSYGDIDFVIRKEDRNKTDILMKKLGYESHGNWEPVYSYKKDTEYYEIHTEMLDSEINDGNQREYFRDFWNHAYQLKDHTYVLDNEYHFLYLLTHLAKHASRRGAGIRMYLDIALYIQKYRDSFDWNHIKEQLDVLGLKRFFYTVCTVCKQWFDVEPPCEIEEIDRDSIDLFTEITLKGGTFGFAETSDAVTAIKESHNKDSKLKTILNQIFPPVNEIEARYTYLQKHRWLYPVALIDRVFRNRKLINRRINTAKEIIQLKDNELRNINNLNKEIGL